MLVSGAVLLCCSYIAGLDPSTSYKGLLVRKSAKAAKCQYIQPKQDTVLITPESVYLYIFVYLLVECSVLLAVMHRCLDGICWRKGGQSQDKEGCSHNLLEDPMSEDPSHDIPAVTPVVTWGKQILVPVQSIFLCWICCSTVVA
jgi:hypothetical protein